MGYDDGTTEGAQMTAGRLTLPIEEGMEQEIRDLVKRLQPDAVRNSDGTSLPKIVSELATKVYATYFPARGDNAWYMANPQQAPHMYLMSERVTCVEDAPLTIDVMQGYFAQQIAPELECDVAKYWQVIDRTTGETLPSEAWKVEEIPVSIDKDREVRNSGPVDHDAHSALVTIEKPQLYHVYTVDFLARQIWDSTQIYNYLTNNWADDPEKSKDRPYDSAHRQTWEHVQEGLDQWLAQHPEVDVVRFTTFFYHFTLVFDDQAREKFADWFGYSAAVSLPALEDFAAAYGYELTPEDFVDAGYYNSPFRTPSAHYKDWIDYTSRQVASKAKVLVDKAHTAGKEAMMFLGDNWIGTEPYGEYFPSIGLDAVVGSVGNACTCRMISDIPGVRYTEGRFLPYFFPDVFREGGDPVREANNSWMTARRAIIRKPLDRMGYGGYLSLAVAHHDFIDRVEEIVNEFRSLHDKPAGELPINSRIRVGIVNAWGKLRTWQTHMVSHALWFKEIWAYQGVIESLAGLPFDVQFLSFDDITPRVPADIDVLINAGSAGSAFSGGDAWLDERLQQSVREFVARGGGFIGVGEPTAVDTASALHTGTTFALSDVLGVDQERGWGLATDRYPTLTPGHFVTADVDELSGQISPGTAARVLEQRFGADFDPGETVAGIYSTGVHTQELARERSGVTLAAHQFGKGRSVYASGLVYSPENSRLLHRAIYWASGNENQWSDTWVSSDARVETAYYPSANLVLAANSSDQELTVQLRHFDTELNVTVAPNGLTWVPLG
ncbi:MAG: 1,3-beta-galactosyl-N-acetylhexosamine phosphorylase [Actinomycetaceae bacterium]|nr:1,3-beta-galactosyl-N-acetylhexosamine phosphorylase [Actinomycetaceae bacterium]MDY6083462.1 1,3-beta-galactosyl-N-acetylhexosamine phosphorylase [Actinomycetaceae bacterium]